MLSVRSNPTDPGTNIETKNICYDKWRWNHLVKSGREAGLNLILELMI